MSTPSNPLATYFSTLQEIFQEQARWRREKAKEYPDDDVRNQAAAIFLTGWPQPLKKSRLMSWRPSSNLSGMNSGNSKLYRKCFARSGTYDTAEDFVRALIANRKAGA